MLQHRLRLTTAGHVQLAGEEVDQLALAVEHRTQVERVPERRAVLLVVDQLDSQVVLRGQRRPDQVDGRRVCGRPLQEAAVPAEDLIRRVASHTLKRFVDEHERHVGVFRVGQAHRHAGHLDRGEEDVLATQSGALGSDVTAVAGVVALGVRCQAGSRILAINRFSALHLSTPAHVIKLMCDAT